LPEMVVEFIIYLLDCKDIS